MLKKQMATMLAVAAMVMAGSAWGYGVEGWPNGVPDHVLKAGKATHSVETKACDCCGGKDSKDGCKHGSSGK